MHVMIDLETLSTKPNAAILTVGAIKFKLDDDNYDNFNGTTVIGMPSYYARVDTESCEAIGCDIDSNTIEWWSAQGQEVMEEAFSPDNREDIRHVMLELNKFARFADGIWSHGSIFDIVILEEIMRRLSITPTWDFWKVRDTRTLYALGNAKLPEASKHHALVDCWRQVVGVQNIMREIGK